MMQPGQAGLAGERGSEVTETSLQSNTSPHVLTCISGCLPAL